IWEFRLDEVARIEQQPQQLGPIAALARDVGRVAELPDLLVQLLRALEIALLARLGRGLRVLALRDERVDLHKKRNYDKRPPMNQRAIGVIGGSGLYEIEGLTQIEEVQLDTPFGAPS